MAAMPNDPAGRRASSPGPSAAEIAVHQRAYGAAAIGAFKAFGLILVAALGFAMAWKSPDTIFRPDARLVRELGPARAVLTVEALFAVMALIGLAWMVSRVKHARRLLSRIRALRAGEPGPV